MDKKQIKLGKVGPKEANLFEDAAIFKTFLLIEFHSEEKRSYPAQICYNLFKFPKAPNGITKILKTSEYVTTLKYIKRLEDKSVIKKSKEKLQYNLSYYTINYQKITELMLKHLFNEDYDAKEKLKNIDLHNSYIQYLIKLYFKFLSRHEDKIRVELTFNRAFEDFSKQLFDYHYIQRIPHLLSWDWDFIDKYQYVLSPQEIIILTEKGFLNSPEKQKEIDKIEWAKFEKELDEEYTEEDIKRESSKEPMKTLFDIPEEIRNKLLLENLKIHIVENEEHELFRYKDTQRIENIKDKDKQLYDFYKFIMLLYSYYYDKTEYYNVYNHFTIDAYGYIKDKLKIEDKKEDE